MDQEILRRDRLLRQLKLSAKAQQKPQRITPRVDTTTQCPLSYAQQRLWFLDHFDGAASAYNVTGIALLSGRLDKDALQRALQATVERHETLRTRFEQIDGEPVQLIDCAARFVMQETQMEALSDTEREKEVMRLATEEGRERFDLARGPLIRVRLLTFGNEEHALILTMHHIVSDGWSMGVLIRDIGSFYTTYCEGRENTLPPLSIQYADYAVWQRKWLQGTVLREQLQYWQDQLSGAPALLQLPMDRLRPAVQSYRGQTIGFSLDAQLTRSVKELGKRHNATLFMTLYAGLSILLSKLSGETDIVIGIPTANRQRTELEPLVGFFVNMLAVRTQVDGAAEVGALLNGVKQSLLSAYSHQDIPFEQVVEALQPSRTLSHSPLFQVSLSLQNATHNEQKLPGLTMTTRAVPNTAAKFDLSWSLQELEDRITGSVHFASDLFDRATVERWVGFFLRTLNAITQPEIGSIESLSLLSDSERKQVLRDFNSTQAEYPRDAVLHVLFERQAERTPDALAVICDDERISYGELNRRANRLAHYLRKREVGPDCLVGICCERGVEMIVGLLGVLKAGGAYVPLDPNYPKDRLAYMLEDAAPRVVLTQARLLNSLPQKTTLVALDSDWAQIQSESPFNLDVTTTRVDSRHLAYVIYTSGSTGRPKGVMVEHRNLANLVAWHCKAFDIVASSRTSCVAAVGFDACTWEIWPTLSAGATLLLADEAAVRNPEALLDWWNEQAIECGFLSTPMAEVAFARGVRNTRLRTLLVGGDRLHQRPMDPINFTLVNNYGPTECTVVATSGQIHANDGIHIGRPISNVSIYILDNQGEPVPIGVPGEIYIGGAGVARGYLNRAELTFERFVKNPFEVAGDARMYKTGDIARWRADGAIEFIGRNDEQVKMRGIRIELGEIQSQLAQLACVKEAVVLARADGSAEKRLVAYVTLVDGQPQSSDELREQLRGTLPEYMVPAAIVILAAMPVTSNGKIDRRALPAPAEDAYARARHEAPIDEFEAVLAELWRDLLGVERVGRHDNFFELGGHSLLIMRLIERLRHVGVNATVRNVFEYPTLSALAASLRDSAFTSVVAPPNLIPDGCDRIVPSMLTLLDLNQTQIDRVVATVDGGAANIQDIYPLAPLQEGILFHHLLSVQGDTYVLSSLVTVDSEAQVIMLLKGLQMIIDRHDILRTAVVWEDLPRPVQVVYRRVTLFHEKVELVSDRSAQEQMQECMALKDSRIDIRRAPLVRVRVAHDTVASQWFVLLQQHHITSDHIGQEILLSELTAYLAGQTEQWTKPTAYREFVWQTLAHNASSDAESFFKRKLSGIDAPTALFGLVNVHGGDGEIDEVHCKLDAEVARRLRVQARRLGVTAATVLHAAWALVVARTSARNDVVFGSVLLGRMQGAKNIDRMLGMFINTLPLRLRLAECSAEQLVLQVQREVMELLQHEQAPLALAQRCSELAAATPLFNAVLNYRHGAVQGKSHQESELKGRRRFGIKTLESRERTNYPVTVSITDDGVEFRFTAQTDPRISAQSIVGYLNASTASLVDALEHAPQGSALALPVLSQAELNRVLIEFNNTQAPYSKAKSIHQLFSEQAARTPNAIAVVYEDQQLTYGELHRKTNQLAHYLRKQGIGPDRLVAIFVERGVEMLIGVLGVLKAGGAYIPLDPNYPAERLAYMLQDATPDVVLTQSRLQSALPQSEARSIELDSSWAEIAQECALDPSTLGQSSSHLAYVIYTSGSTGKPKGVMVTHLGVTNFLNSMRERPGLTANDRLLAVTTLSFDIAGLELYLPLLNGAKLVIASRETASNPSLLAAALERFDITVMQATPASWRMLLSAGWIGRSTLKALCGGEALTVELAGQLKAKVGELWNLYGPTETTIWSCTRQITAQSTEDTQSVSIGRPIANTRIYILDARKQPVPIGVAGEIYIGGWGVARGYLGKPDLTAERFFADPFSDDANARIYKTGDLGSFRANGDIDFLGRNDAQVKIRGFRIELGEIESRLLSHAGIKDAVVIAREDVPGEQRLVAYVTYLAGASPTNEELRGHLRDGLPDYMLPAAVVALDVLPLTPNGKLDRKSLPAPDNSAYAIGEYEPPQGPVEETLATIWCELLQVERVGRNDNFFELGGHSLLAVQLLTRIQSEYSITLALNLILQFPTVSTLAKRIAEGVSDKQRFQAVELGGRDLAFNTETHEEILL